MDFQSFLDALTKILVDISRENSESFLEVVEIVDRGNHGEIGNLRILEECLKDGLPVHTYEGSPLLKLLAEYRNPHLSVAESELFTYGFWPKLKKLVGINRPRNRRDQ